MDGAIRSRKKRDRRDVLPDDAGAVAVLIVNIHPFHVPPSNRERADSLPSTPSNLIALNYLS